MRSASVSAVVVVMKKPFFLEQQADGEFEVLQQRFHGTS